MTSKVGDIAIGVHADIDPLRRNLQSGTKSLRQFSKQAGEYGKRFAQSFAIMSAAAAAATVAIVNSQRKSIDALAKTADALAITTEKLQALNHLAELNGVSSEQMAKGLQRMERGLGEAARKGGTTADALRDAGVAIKDIINLSPDEQIQQLANALGSIENQAIKASIASDLFGRDGVKMLKVLTQLRKDGIEPTAEKLEALGISISRVDAARVEAANDALYTSQQVLSGIANTITIELSDYIKVLSDRFNDAAEASGGFGDEVRSAIETGLRLGAKFSDWLNNLRVGFKAIEFGIAALDYRFAQFNLSVEQVMHDFTNSSIKAVNTVIAALNKIPKVDIGFVSPADSTNLDRYKAELEVSINKLDALGAELDNTLSFNASEEMDLFIEKARHAKEEAASLGKVLNGNLADSETDSFGAWNQNNGNTNQVNTGSVNVANDEFGFGPMTDPFDPEAIAAKNEELLQLDRDFWTNKGAIADHGLTSITSMIEQKQGKQAGAYANSFASILSSTASYSKKAFEINKKFALGEAVVKGFQSATAAWSAGMSTGGPQAPFVAAAYLAASLAKTGAQIKAIKSQSFGGGGSGSAGGGTGGASGALPGAAVSQQSNVQPISTIVNMTVQGDSISRSQFGSITKQLNEEHEAGYRLNVR